MALIHLPRLLRLENEASFQKGLVSSYFFNCSSKENVPDAEVMLVIIKAHAQAKNIYNRLQRLHQTCLDFSKGNFTPYIDEYRQIVADPRKEPYCPFRDLLYWFDSGMVDDLPERIEQYAELVGLAHAFPQSRKAMREGIDHFFGDLPRYYLAANETGERVAVPSDQLSEAVQHRLTVQQEIADINVEYALDGYNEFYQCATGLISAYMGGDAQACAEALLALFGHAACDHESY